MCTDNPILLKRTLNSPTIVCVQRKAKKKVVTEDDIIQANKLAFNDDIGIITNHVTSMFEVQAGVPKESPEYKVLEYRIMSGQLFQQNAIDRAKGIIAKPMPSYWYSLRDNKISEGDDEKTIEKKKFNERIVAARKPYFMTYVYPNLRSKNSEYQRNSNYDAESRYYKNRIHDIDDLKECSEKTDDMKTFLSFYERQMPVGKNPCVVNRICGIVEDAFDGYMSKKPNGTEFDYSILKSNVEYSKSDYNKISHIYNEYLRMEKLSAQKTSSQKNEKCDGSDFDVLLSSWFRRECEEICTNEEELCDIVLDICYQKESSKRFAWAICGNQIVENVLNRTNRVIHFPEQVKADGEFTYFGKQFVMREKKIGGGDLVDYLE